MLIDEGQGSQDTGQEPYSTSQRPRDVRSLHHALDVIEVLSISKCPLGVSEVARRTQLGKSTVHSIMRTLEDRGVIERAAKGYQVGWHLFALGVGVIRQLPLTTIAQPDLHNLAQRTGEGVHLGFLARTHVSYAISLNPHRNQGIGSQSGIGPIEVPLYATAGGKVLLAERDKGFVDNVMSTAQPLTSRTIVDRNRFELELAEVRNRGFATCWQEHMAGVSAVSVPVRDRFGESLAVLTIAGPADTITEQAVGPLVTLLRQAVHHIEGQLHRVPASAAC